MRLAVLSDIHGNLPALQAIMAALQDHEIDGCIIAGDLTGGPQANETLTLLKELNCWIILGNSDINLLSYANGKTPAAWRTNQQFALLRWAHHHLKPETLEFICSLPEQMVCYAIPKAPIRIVHGSPRDPYEEMFPERDMGTLASALVQITEPVLVCGHTHLQWTLRRNGKLALNPGAVCGSLNGDVRAHYALLTWQKEGWQAELCTAAYDLKEIREAFQESGLLEEGGALARAFLASIETGRNVGKDFLEFAHKLMSKAGITDTETIPDRIWEQAAESFRWDAYLTE